MKLAVLLFVFVYYGFVLGLRSWMLYRKTGVNAATSMEVDGVAGFNNKVILLCTVLIPVIAFNYVFLEKNYQYLVPITYLEQVWIQWVGTVSSFFGLILSFMAQVQMGNSWRIAYQERETTALITHGLYGYSRNPVYLGLGLAFLGFFLMVPNALCLCFLLLMYTSVEIKIRLEEAYLERQHPVEYPKYRAKVRRWI